MSDADREDVSVSADGITVKKTLNAQESSSATIVLKIRSARDSTVRLQLRETLPDGFTEGTVGFHPDYGDEYWSIAGETVVFERSFAPDEEFTTVYGLREIEDSAREQLESEPKIEIVDEDADEESAAENESQPDENQRAEATAASGEPEELEDIVSEANSQPVQEVIAGERDTLPGLSHAGRDTDEADEAAADAGGETEDGPLAGDTDEDSGEPRESGQDRESGDEIDRSNPGANTETAFGSATEDETTEEMDGDETDSQTAMTETAAGSDSEPTDVASALAEQLRAGNVSAADREILREELATDNSTEARVEHLQSEVSELAAYTEALEEFIDEEGTAQQVLDDLETEIDRFEERLSDIEERIGDDLDDLGGEIERLDDSLMAVEERLDGHDERLDSHEKRVEMAEGHISDVETIQSGIESDVEDIRDSVEEMEEFRERLTDTLSRLTGGVEPESSDDE